MKDPTSIAVTSRSFSDHPVLRSELLELFENVTFNAAGRSLRGPELIHFLRGHERAIIALEPLDEELFAALPELGVVSKYGVGLDTIDLGAMARHGVRLGWTAGVNRRSVSELVVAAAIQLLHGAVQSAGEVRAGKWRQIVGRQLSGKTVGIIGCGNIGKDAALLFRAFGCPVVANDILDFAEFYERHEIRALPIDALLLESDVVTVHVPLDDTTRNLLSRGRLATMKRGAVLINMSRGGVVDDGAVREMLLAGHLWGAAFDVFEVEPPSDRELVSLPNFLPTAHIGGSTEEAILAMGRAAIDGLSKARPVTEVFPHCPHW